MDEKRELREHLEECQEVMQGIFLTGFAAMNGSLEKDMIRLIGIAEQYGLQRLATWLQSFRSGLEELRHCTSQHEEQEWKLVALFCDISEYLELGIRKCVYDEVESGIR